MKILRLTFSNLNSLAGRHAIDFTAPPLADSGLFAITGPTGAGKSTLLDAITLALFGRAARYREPNPGEVMSRFTGECWSEVEFSCAAGNYRARWSLRRARGRSEGKLQAAERKIISLPEQTVLTSKVDESNRKIEELTGLDCDRFLRSVMLAQGEFAAFLRASVSERTELLEKVTGTGIYSILSIEAYEAAQRARADLDQTRLTASDLRPFTPEERTQRETERASAREGLEQLRGKLVELTLRLDTATRYGNWASEHALLVQQREAAEKETVAFAPDAARLFRHEKALPLAPRLETLDALATTAATLEREVADAERQRVALSQTALSTQDATTAAQTTHDRLRAGEPELRALWAEVGRIDQHVTQLALALQEAQVNESSLCTEHAQRQRESLDHAKKESLLCDEAARADSWLKAHAEDAALGASLPDLERALAEWATLEAERERRGAEHAGALETGQLRRDELANRAEQERQAALQLQEHADRHGLAERMLAEALNGRSAEDWEAARTEAVTAVTRADRLCQLASDHEEVQRALEQAESGVATFVGELERLGRMREAQAVALKARSGEVQARREALDLQRQLQDLEGRRHLLRDGQPCPLCGALVHPHAALAASGDDAVSGAAERLEAALRAEVDARGALQQAEVEQTKAETERSAADRTAMQLRQRLAAVVEQHRQSAENLHLAGAPDGAEAAKVRQEAKERLARIDAAREQQRAREQDVRRAREALASVERQAAGARTAFTTAGALEEQARNTMALSARALAAAEDAATAAKARLTAAVRELSVDLTTPSAAERSLGLFRTRLAAYREKHAKHAALQADLTNLRTALRERRVHLEELQGRAVQAALRREAAARSHQETLELRRQRFGERSPAAEENDFLGKLNECSRVLQARAAEAEAARLGLVRAQTRLDHLRAQQAGTAAQREQVDRDFKTERAASGLGSIEDLRAALLPRPEARGLAERQEALQRQALTLDTRIASSENARKTFGAQAVVDAGSIAAVETTLRDAKEAERTAADTLASLETSLKQDDNVRVRLASLAETLAVKEKEAARWHRLSELIGSASGTAFARFAQGLTLDQLVRRANAHLAHLNPRYGLKRSAEGPLELQVVDHFQFDAERPMASLSGGESFLVSLALALGLSELASGRVAIESLFIDEGFGTLDAETLDTAMCALENLRTRGKTIGVISHVDAMKDRIRTQIVVRKLTGGRSTVEVVSMRDL